MIRLPMLENIFAQPSSHDNLLDYHEGDGKGDLEECAASIRSAKGRILFSGMGASLFAAIPAVTELVKKGYPAQAVESSELLHYGTTALRSADLGVLISRSGGSIEVIRLAEAMRGAGMTVVGVTNVAGSPLEKLADVSLMISSRADQLIAIQTYTGTVLALLLLAEQVATGAPASLLDAARAALPALESWISGAVDVSEGWRELLDSGSPLYLLGRGAALASAQEGALLLHETAKAAAVAMSSGQFRHGPVEYISSQSRVVIFGAPEPTRAIDSSLARDLLHMGAQVRWIGPRNGGDRDEVPAMATWPEIDPVLAPIFDIVPLQLASYRLALWRGVTPGDFRYASEITSAESGFPLFQSKSASS